MMTKSSTRKTAIRKRMAETEEPYSVAARHYDSQKSADIIPTRWKSLNPLLDGGFKKGQLYIFSSFEEDTHLLSKLVANMAYYAASDGTKTHVYGNYALRKETRESNYKRVRNVNRKAIRQNLTTEETSYDPEGTELAIIDYEPAMGENPIAVIANNFVRVAEDENVPVVLFYERSDFTKEDEAKQLPIITPNIFHIEDVHGMVEVKNVVTKKQVNILFNASEPDEAGWWTYLSNKASGNKVEVPKTAWQPVKDGLPVLEDTTSNFRWYPALGFYNEDNGKEIVRIFNEGDVCLTKYGNPLPERHMTISQAGYLGYGFDDTGNSNPDDVSSWLPTHMMSFWNLLTNDWSGNLSMVSRLAYEIRHYQSLEQSFVQKCWVNLVIAYAVYLDDASYEYRQRANPDWRSMSDLTHVGELEQYQDLLDNDLANAGDLEKFTGEGIEALSNILVDYDEATRMQMLVKVTTELSYQLGIVHNLTSTT